MKPETLSEAAFAEQMKLPRDLVAEVRTRALRSPEHYIQAKGGPVLLTALGVDALLGALGAMGNQGGRDSADATRLLLLKDRAREELAVLVVARQVQNPRQVLCWREGAAGEAAPAIVLQVPTYREGLEERNHFTPGLRVAARRRAGAVWDYVGTRPRFRGHLEQLQAALPQGSAETSPDVKAS